ncbi:hypothetical protein GH714_009216 [Hevea brasiliensis]|uniref:Uncharacterized protein n=1 Tax=Hevea brasiliensis TaxID=3981 RepID=A0A6A6L209_HEVBR|nr:hypothetical protein GH714_009216 [Hevea brasiliensis]
MASEEKVECLLIWMEKYQLKELNALGGFFFNEDERIRANDEFANFSLKSGPFADPDSIGSMYVTDPRNGGHVLILMHLYFKAVGQDAIKMAQNEERLDLLQGESRETRKEMEILKHDFKKLHEGIKKDAARIKLQLRLLWEDWKP